MTDKTKACAAQHFGWWLAKPTWLNAVASAYASGMMTADNASHASHTNASAGVPVYLSGDSEYMPPLYVRTDDGIAVINLHGQFTKGQSSFGGTSNVRARQAVRTAERDPDVLGIMLSIDSPGGTVAGQAAFASEIARVASAGDKPVHAHAEDGMHSAALWAGTQANVLTASATTEIGSIGVVAAVHDYSGAFEKEGVKVHVISTGDYKGAFTPGTEVTEDMLSQVQQRVDELNEFFVGAISKGRGMSKAKIAKLATGEDWMAAQAVDLGLIDAVMTDDQAMSKLRSDIKSYKRRKASEERTRRNRIRAASL